MINQPLVGYVRGTDYGSMDATTYAQFAPDASQAERQYQRESQEPGFAAVIHTWQDSKGKNEVRELAFHFDQAQQATATVLEYERVLSAGGGHNRFSVPGVTGAAGFLIAVTGPSSSQVTDQLQIVVMHFGDYAFLIETDVQPGPSNSKPIQSGTVVDLAEHQYSRLPGAARASTAPSPGGTGTPTKTWLPLISVLAVLAVAAAVFFGIRIGTHQPQHARKREPRLRKHTV